MTKKTDNSIILKHPIKLASGDMLKTITFARLPTRRDYKNAVAKTSDPDEQVWEMICAISAEKLVIEDTEDLVLVDVRAGVEAFRDFSGI